MTAPYFADEHVTLHLGDALSVLSGLPSGSVDCCVTSPPYFGLRDYGTGRWDGGDSDCTHRRPATGGNPTQGANKGNNNAEGTPFRDVCGICGALRFDQQYGLESSPAEYVETMRAVFAEVRRVLADDGTLWLNLGDSFNAYNGNRGATTGFSRNDPLPALPKGAGLTAAGLPAKNLLGIPWRVAFALQDDSWILRNDIIWAKPNGMPESVTDRLSTKHEHVFMFSKSPRYWFDLDAVREEAKPRDGRDGRNWVAPTWSDRKANGETSGNRMPGAVGVVPRKGALPTPDRGANPGDVWSIPASPFPESHFACFPLALAERCILAGCKPTGTVLDPFSGSGTTGLAATKHGRRYVGIDLSADYLHLSLRTRLVQATLDFGST